MPDARVGSDDWFDIKGATFPCLRPGIRKVTTYIYVILRAAPPRISGALVTPLSRCRSGFRGGVTKSKIRIDGAHFGEAVTVDLSNVLMIRGDGWRAACTSRRRDRRRRRIR